MPPPYGPCGPLPLAGRIVLITGGGSGIGLAFAIQCLSHSALVIVGDLNLTEEARSVFDAAGSSKIIYRKCDVTKWSDLHDLISASVGAFGSVPDVYAPVAGIFEPGWSNFWDDTEDDDGSYKTLRINVDHPIKLTRLAMRALAGAEKKGVVCLVASTAAIRANYLACLYSASKHAILGFTKSMLEADFEEGVRIVCVFPALVDSPLWRDRKDAFMSWTKFHDRPAIFPKDVADVMVRMVEDEKDEYSGGSCVLKSALEERVFEKGWKAAQGGDVYDPSPRPQADPERIRKALDKERGRKWT